MGFIVTAATPSARFHDVTLSGSLTTEVPDASLTEIRDMLSNGGKTVSDYYNTVEIPFPALAAGADASFPIWWSPIARTITAIYLMPVSNLVGHATNYSTLLWTTYTAAGAVSTTVVSKAYSAVATVVGMTKGDQGTLTNGALAAGYGLMLTRSTAGSGLAIPNSLIIIHYR